jgi:Collagen triple helix repeat (20 copies)
MPWPEVWQESVWVDGIGFVPVAPSPLPVPDAPPPSVYQGPKGDEGDQGPVGPQGSQGVAGPTGPVGPDGATGPQGIQGVVGPQGPAGPTAAYTHTQFSASATWTVAHNLGFRPDVAVTTTGGLEVFGGEVLHLSDNTLQVSFDVAFAGQARCL